jgi:hypothetical protein
LTRHLSAFSLIPALIESTLPVSSFVAAAPPPTLQTLATATDSALVSTLVVTGNSSTALLSGTSPNVGVYQTAGLEGPTNVSLPASASNVTVVIAGLEALGPVAILLPKRSLGVPPKNATTIFSLPVPFNNFKIVVPAGVWVADNFRRYDKAAPELTVTVFVPQTVLLNVPGPNCGPMLDLGPRGLRLPSATPIMVSLPCGIAGPAGAHPAVHEFEAGSGVWRREPTVAARPEGSGGDDAVLAEVAILAPQGVFWVFLPALTLPVLPDFAIAIICLCGVSVSLAACAAAFLYI